MICYNFSLFTYSVFCQITEFSYGSELMGHTVLSMLFYDQYLTYRKVITSTLDYLQSKFIHFTLRALYALPM
jgi:hypothetical protein